MNLFYSILVAIAVIIAIAFSALVLLTGKGDAMSGGSGVRTTFKGMASFDDIMSRWTLYIGVAFMALVLVIGVVGKRLDAATPSLSTGGTTGGAEIERNVSVTPPPAPSPAPGSPGMPTVPPNITAPPVPAPSVPPASAGLPPTNPEAINPPLNSAPATTVPSVVPTPAPATTAGR